MNITNSPNINYLWTNLIVEELIRNGVKYFCIAPGSRSAPLSMAVANNPKAKTFVHFDERGLAFHALGYASATKKPCTLISTSGTAAANFFPAIVEASKKKIPLIVITADRPPEMRFTGANQTIDQVKIFGDYMRWFFDFPCPTTDIRPEVILTTIDQAVSKSLGELKGPVHLNCMFRDSALSPLAPISAPIEKSYLKTLSTWLKSTNPYTQYILPQKMIPDRELNNVATRINKIQNGIIVVGKLADAQEQEKVLALAEHLNWPLWPDVSSGLRLNSTHPNVIHYFDQVLLNEKFIKNLKIDGVIHLGGRMTSARYYQWLEKAALNDYIMALNHPLRNDPTHSVTHRVQLKPGDFCDQLKNLTKPRKAGGALSKLQKANYQVDLTLEKYFEKDQTLSEPFVCRMISHMIPNNTGLFLASSLPIREMDMFAQPKDSNVEVNANRGASGIDGTIASAAGFNVGLNKPVTLVIGDLAFLHDLNSLAMTKDLKHPLVIVVLNNDGGGIFNLLPIAKNNPHFEKLFGTPHGLTFKGAAEMFNLNSGRSARIAEFVDSYKKALKEKRPTIIEVKTDRDKNFKLHQLLKEKIIAKII